MPTFQATIFNFDGDATFFSQVAKVTKTPALWGATTPIEADLIQSEAPVFTTVAISVLDGTTIRVTFPVPAKNNSALIQPGNYVITPSLTVYAVTPEAVANPNYVDLTIDEQTTGISYEVEVQGVEKA